MFRRLPRIPLAMSQTHSNRPLGHHRFPQIQSRLHLHLTLRHPSRAPYPSQHMDSSHHACGHSRPHGVVHEALPRQNRHH